MLVPGPGEIVRKRLVGSARELWCREGESNPQGPKPGGF
jgi:hypothetical protein